MDIPQLPQEDPPADFTTDTTFISGGQTLNRYSAWIALIHCLATSAFQDWNARQYRLDCTSAPRVSIKVVGNPRPGDPPLLVKHIMWSLLAVARFWESPSGGPSYADTNFEPKVAAQRLGRGKVFSTGIGTSSSSAGDDNNDDASRIALPAAVYNQSTTRTSTSPLFSSSLSSLANLTQDEVKLEIPFDLTTPVLCTPSEFYIILMQAIVKLGTKGPREPSIGVRYYYAPKDMTFEIGATSAAAAQDLTQYKIVFALETLAEFMYAQSPEKRFHGFVGRWKWNDRIVGRVNMFRGRAPGGDGWDDVD
ncbi:uncharacterized protein KY384_001726 [Bacidia gigantensis]|uniref:uncharacterized protein n=1 Tax=Bacidia gigantensis TaxID=2732470 RepID=UPI001D03DE42|nr:uncharacterized protein KY384_001726 [Bacidia gigantensis]KAG8533983.1 hypothetical protein KY384_001726 [Bacidia gigantensis]